MSISCGTRRGEESRNRVVMFGFWRVDLVVFFLCVFICERLCVSATVPLKICEGFAAFLWLYIKQVDNIQALTEIRFARLFKVNSEVARKQWHGVADKRRPTEWRVCGHCYVEYLYLLCIWS